MFNCVGHYNYRYFVLFLVYIFTGCLFAMSLAMRPFLRIQGFLPSDPALPGPLYENAERQAYTHGLAISLSAALGVGILLLWHTYLCITNQTTLEFHINSEMRQERPGYRNPFDTGSWKKNLQRVFGRDSPSLLAILPSVRDPPEPTYPFYFSDFRQQDVHSSNSTNNSGSHSSALLRGGVHKV